MPEEGGLLGWDRVRTIAIPAAVVVAAILVVAVSLTMVTGGTLAATFSAADVSVSSSDGTISSVTITPDFDAQWSDLDTGTDNLGYQIEVSDDGSTYESLVVATMDCSNPNADFSCGSTSGSQAIYDGQVTYDLLADGDYQSGTSPFSASDFSASQGSSKTTTVHLRVTTSLDDSNGNLIKETTVTKTFDVTVTHTGSQATLTISGVMNTNAST